MINGKLAVSGGRSITKARSCPPSPRGRLCNPDQRRRPRASLKANHELTFALDQPLGADQYPVFISVPRLSERTLP